MTHSEFENSDDNKGMRSPLILSAVIALTGCATSSGIVPTGPDSYMVSRSGGYGAAATGPVLADAFRDANDFCDSKGKKFEVVHSQEVPFYFGHRPEAKLDFMCLDAGDPQLRRPMMASDPQKVVERVEVQNK